MTDFQTHLTDEDVERFSSKTLAESDVERIEGHLLFCNQCLDAVEASEAADAVIRLALQAAPARKPSRKIMHAGSVA